MKEAPRMKNGTFMVSLAMHAAVATFAFIYAARYSAPEPPAEQVVWIDLTAPADKAPPRPADPPKVEAPAPRPAAAPRPASPSPARPAMPASVAGNHSGVGHSGGGLGVLAGDGA